jgi:hypothetical protein
LVGASSGNEDLKPQEENRTQLAPSAEENQEHSRHQIERSTLRTAQEPELDVKKITRREKGLGRRRLTHSATQHSQPRVGGGCEDSNPSTEEKLGARTASSNGGSVAGGDTGEQPAPGGETSTKKIEDRTRGGAPVGENERGKTLG